MDSFSTGCELRSGAVYKQAYIETIEARMFYLVTAALSAALGTLFTGLILWLARRNRWFDHPNARKLHSGEIPRLGGVAIAWSFAITLALALLVFAPLRNRVATPLPTLLLVVGGFLTVHFMGLADDFLNLRARLKLVFQLAVALAVILAGYVFKEVRLPFLDAPLELGYWTYPLTFFWILGVMNAVNLIDGMDGFAGGISAIVFSTWTFVAFKNNDPTAGAVSAALAGACVGFLFWNFSPASIFMGDSGSLFLGAAFAIVPLILEEPGNLANGFLPALVISAIPILDTLMAIIRRVRRRRSIMSPDREHFHHKLLDLGLGVRRSLAVIYGLQLLLAGTVAASVYLGYRTGGWLMLGAGALASLGFLRLHYVRKAMPEVDVTTGR